MNIVELYPRPLDWTFSVLTITSHSTDQPNETGIVKREVIPHRTAALVERQKIGVQVSFIDSLKQANTPNVIKSQITTKEKTYTFQAATRELHND